MSTTGSGAAIWVKGLRKSYGQGPVLRDLDLALDWGQSLALLGANGAGKTTLLRILSTQARPDAGTVMVAGGHLPRQASAVRHRVGLVGHASLLYEDLTCRENLIFYGRLFRVPGLHQRVQAVLSRLGLAGQADRRVRTLSHGQQKRLSIGRAILHNPRLLLLDEAESGLDQESLTVLRAIVAEWTAPNRAVVMTTHNRDLGKEWTGRVAELSEGRLHLAGQPAVETGR